MASAINEHAQSHGNKSESSKRFMEADINCKIEAYLGSQNEEMTSFIKQGNYFTKDISLR